MIKIILMILTLSLVLTSNTSAQDECIQTQYDNAVTELKTNHGQYFQEYFYEIYQGIDTYDTVEFYGSYSICTNALDFPIRAKAECHLFKDSSQFNTLMKYKGVEKKFIHSISVCKELKLNQKSITYVYEGGVGDPMKNYKSIAYNSCLAAISPSIIINPLGFNKKYKYCKKLTEDLFEIVAPKCSNILENSKEEGNHCTALYGHVANEIVKRPELDKIINNFVNVFKRNTSKIIGHNFLEYLEEIGDGKIKDALLILSMFSSRITQPLIKELLYESKQFKRLGNLSYILDFQIDDIALNLRPIYYGKEMVRFGEKWITLSRKYHFFAALYIGCELKSRGHSDFLVRLSTASIGLAYESKDFYGHYFLEGDSLELSLRNFEVDSGKYFEGGKLATEICQNDSSL